VGFLDKLLALDDRSASNKFREALEDFCNEQSEATMEKIPGLERIGVSYAWENIESIVGIENDCFSGWKPPRIDRIKAMIRSLINLPTLYRRQPYCHDIMSARGPLNERQISNAREFAGGAQSAIQDYIIQADRNTHIQHQNEAWIKVYGGLK
jgi:hypothetical protein